MLVLLLLLVLLLVVVVTAEDPPDSPDGRPQCPLQTPFLLLEKEALSPVHLEIRISSPCTGWG